MDACLQEQQQQQQQHVKSTKENPLAHQHVTIFLLYA